jgi:hypothetical protein
MFRLMLVLLRVTLVEFVMMLLLLLRPGEKMRAWLPVGNRQAPTS